MARILVDGYNVLRGVPRYAGIAATDIDAARERLIADLGARAAAGDDVVVVFDAAANPLSDGAEREVGGVTVIFSPSGTDADSVIEALAARARREGVETEVVTSDVATRWTSVGGSVTVRRSPSFAEELAEDERGWRGHAADRGGRSTVEDVVDERTRSELRRLRGGGTGRTG